MGLVSSAALSLEEKEKGRLITIKGWDDISSMGCEVSKQG